MSTIKQQAHQLRRQLAGRRESAHKQMALRRLRDCLLFDSKGLDDLAQTRLIEARQLSQFAMEV